MQNHKGLFSGCRENELREISSGGPGAGGAFWPELLQKGFSHSQVGKKSCFKEEEEEKEGSGGVG